MCSGRTRKKKYTKGLVALWRETLLAKNVLLGHTKGYKNHPQLNRFKEHDHPIVSINKYLIEIYEESLKRNFKFNKDKIDWSCNKVPLKRISVSSGQVNYEFKHLLQKLYARDPEKYYLYIDVDILELNALFDVYVDNKIEYWEKVA